MIKLTRCFMLGTALCIVLSACKGSSILGEMLHQRPRTTLVLVDASGSIAPEDRPIYVNSLLAIAQSLQPGEHLLIAKIGNEDRGAFRATLDLTVSASDIRLDREAAVAAARAQVEKAVPSLVPENPGSGSNSTLILAAIASGAQVFGAGPHENDRLLVISDAVEEGGPAVDLMHIHADPASISGALKKAREAGLLPVLDGVEMTVAGAGGSNYVAVENFWRAYAIATHAKLVAYGRLPFRPST